MVMMPLTITMIISSVISSFFIQKVGVRLQLAAGMAILAAGFVLLMTMGDGTSRFAVSGYMLFLGFGLGLIMPIITLALQESYPSSELGVVTSSSTFFRQIGGTFGMTILGVIMNLKSSHELQTHLLPKLERLPAEVDDWKNRMTELARHDPQQLFSSLLNPDSLTRMPPVLLKEIVPQMKITLVDSLQAVFLWGAVFVLFGLLLTPLTGKIKITAQSRAKERMDSISFH